MSWKSMPYISLLGLFFGTSLVASRFSVGQFDSTTYIGLRLVIGSLGFGLVYAFGFQGRRLPRDPMLWLHASLLGVFSTAVSMNMIAMSMKYLSSGLTSILITFVPGITVAMAHFALPDEKLDRRKVVGIGVALLGALALALKGESGITGVERANPLGYLLVVGGMFFGTAGTIYMRRYMQAYDAVDASAVRMLAAALVGMPFSVAYARFDLSGVTIAGYAALVYAAVFGTFMAMVLQYYNVQRFGATSAAMTAYIIPVAASLGGILILDETFTPMMLLGMVLIIGGIAILNDPSPLLGRVRGPVEPPPGD